MFKLKSIIVFTLFVSFFVSCNTQLPSVITTWKFTAAAEEAWKTLQNSSALDAIERGCSVCEINQCDGTVGYGGSPDENGETTLDAMIMDGTGMDVGAVGGLRRIKNVISVARHVLEHTTHSMLVGDLATNFAKAMGFKEESLSSKTSVKIWNKWKNADCQPNSWINVKPDPKTSCGPYTVDKINKIMEDKDIHVGEFNHDTIGMVAIDKSGNIAAGTSTNGLRHKIPGRVGDSPIPGSGAYADSTVGGAAATGDGDIMLRFLPSFLAVEAMRNGKTPTEAAKISVLRMAKFYPKFSGGVIAINKDGEYGAGCHGMEKFPFSVANSVNDKVEVEYVECGEPNTVQF